MQYTSEMERAMWKYFCENVYRHSYKVLLSSHTVAWKHSSDLLEYVFNSPHFRNIWIILSSLQFILITIAGIICKEDCYLEWSQLETSTKKS